MTVDRYAELRNTISAARSMQKAIVAEHGSDSEAWTAEVCSRFDRLTASEDASTKELRSLGEASAKAAPVTRAKAAQTAASHAAASDWSARQILGSGFGLLRSEAMRAVERTSRYMSPKVQDELARLVDADASGTTARHVIVHSDPEYVAGWKTELLHRPVTSPAQRAALDRAHEFRSVEESGTGGDAVPPFLDPSLLIVGGLGFSPVAQNCSRVSVPYGSSYTGVVASAASFAAGAEGSVFADGSLYNNTTGGNGLVQLSIPLYRVASDIPYSFEVGQDAFNDPDGFVTQMSKALTDGLQGYLAQSTLVGSGVAPNPLGLFTSLQAATLGSPTIEDKAHIVVATSGTLGFVDVRAAYASLGDLTRSRCSFICSEGQFNLLRAQGASGVAALTDVTYDNDGNPRLFGRPVYRSSYALQNLTGSTSGTAAYMAVVDLSLFTLATRLGTHVEIAEYPVPDQATGRPNLTRHLITICRLGHQLAPGAGVLIANS